MNLLKNIVYFILSIQEKVLTKSLSKTLGINFSSKRKKIYQNGCLLNLETIAESEKLKMEEELKLILKTYNYNPKEILDYIKKHGTNAYYINSAKALHSIGENEGFILPQKGAKALYFSLLTQKKVSFKTEEMYDMILQAQTIVFHTYRLYTDIKPCLWRWVVCKSANTELGESLF